MSESMTAAERRELAGELADELADRGLTLLDVERLAPLMVDRFRQARQARNAVPDDALCG